MNNVLYLYACSTADKKDSSYEFNADSLSVQYNNI